MDTSNYTYIETSAGCGCFYNTLPKKKRIGIDIDPKLKDINIIKKDYLQYKPSKNTKNIVIGNPPFVLRGNLALQFINHSFNFADIVAFILPQLFESDGKGSCMGRVKGYTLAHSEKLPPNSFYTPDGKDININTIFQVWAKINTENIVLEPKKNL